MPPPPDRSAPARARAPARKPPPDSTPAVDEFMAALEHPHKAQIAALRKSILGAHASIAEGVKWNSPSFRTADYFATVNLRAKRGVGVILHLGAKARALPAGGIRIDDPEGMLEWLAKDRAMVEFSDAADLRRRLPAFVAIVRQWIRFV